MNKEKDKKILRILEKADFKCQKCSACCRHDSGAVFLTEEDVVSICIFLSLSVHEFLNKYCRETSKE